MFKYPIHSASSNYKPVFPEMLHVRFDSLSNVRDSILGLELLEQFYHRPVGKTSTTCHFPF